MKLDDFIFELDESQLSERVFVGHHWSEEAVRVDMSDNPPLMLVSTPDPDVVALAHPGQKMWLLVETWAYQAQCSPEDADPSISVEK